MASRETGNDSAEAEERARTGLESLEIERVSFHQPLNGDERHDGFWSEQYTYPRICIIIVAILASIIGLVKILTFLSIQLSSVLPGSEPTQELVAGTFPGNMSSSAVHVAVGSARTAWMCACRANVMDAVARSFLDHDPQKNEATILVFQDKSRCENLLPLTVVDETRGRSCITFESAESACRTNIGRGWWRLKVGRETIPSSELLLLLQKDIQDHTYIEFLRSKLEKGGVYQHKFLELVVPECVESILREFADWRNINMIHRKILRELFEEKDEELDVPFVSYGHLGSKQKINEAFSRHVDIKVGKKVRREHPRFAELRAKLGIRPDFLHNLDMVDADYVKTGVTDQFIVDCSQFSQPTRQAAWRAFHVVADEYFNYMLRSNHSLLPRYLTAFKDEGLLGPRLCFVIQDWLPDTPLRKERNFSYRGFDVKGKSIVDNMYLVDGNNANKRMNSFDWSHDSFLPKDIKQKAVSDAAVRRALSVALPSDSQHRLLEQISKDTKWLEEHSFVGYEFSLFQLAVSSTDRTTLEQVCPWSSSEMRLSAKPPPKNTGLFDAFYQRDHGFVASVPELGNMMYVSAMGLTKALLPWSLSEAIGAARDALLFPKQESGVVAPDTYAERFRKFLSDSLVDSTRVAYIYQTCATMVAFHLPTVNTFNCETLKLEKIDPEVERLERLSQAPFTKAEVKAARDMAGLTDSNCQEDPKAIIFLAPPATIPSTYGLRVPSELSIPYKDSGARHDIVKITGSIWRRNHHGYMALENLGKKYGCIFKHSGGWDGVNRQAVAQQSSLFKKVTSSRCKRNVLIRSSCSDYKQCTSWFTRLKDRGYTIHVYGYYIARRLAIERAQVKGSGSDSLRRFATSLVTFLPLMSLANGNCVFINLNLIKDEKRMELSCPNQSTYDLYSLPEGFQEAEQDIIRISELSRSEYRKAQREQKVEDGDVVAKSLCKSVNMRTNLSGELADVKQLCRSNGMRLNALNPDTKGGSDIFKGKPKKGSTTFVVKSVHPHEYDYWFHTFAPESTRSKWAGGYIVTIVDIWAAFNMKWSLMPDISLEKKDKTYDIKGVPTLRYFKYKQPYRDPNWVRDFSWSDGSKIYVGVSKDLWVELMERLGHDLAYLQEISSIDYSMMIYTDSEATGHNASSFGKKVWPVWAFPQKKIKGVLFGGILDYLENTTSYREGRKVTETIGRALHKRPDVYACRFFFFIMTQMLAPCNWDGTAKAPPKQEDCVMDFNEPMDKLFKDAKKPHVNGATFLVESCAYWDASKTMSYASSVLKEYVDKKLPKSASA